MLDSMNDDHIDKSHWVEWSKDTPLINKHRAAHGDIITGTPCPECDMTGRNENRGVCKECSGKGRIGIRNASGVSENELSEIRFAQIQVKSILNFLWNSEIISDDEHSDGHTYKAWRDQHNVAMGLEKAISNEFESPMTLKLRAHGYILLLKRLSVHDIKAINKAIDVRANHSTERDAIREQRPYRTAFANLARVIIPIKERISYLEGISEDERNMLSDDNMKLLLVDIHKMR
jgi:RecJ-like exonuclease